VVSPAASQQMTLAAGYALADYGSKPPSFTPGSGPSVDAGGWRAGWRSSGWLDLSLDLRVTRRLHWILHGRPFSVRSSRTMSLVGVEAGFLRRSARHHGRTSFSAQPSAYGLPTAPRRGPTWRCEGIVPVPISPGGSRTVGIELGLSAGYGPGSADFAHWDYQFQRIDWPPTRAAAGERPDPSSIARLALG